MNLVKNIYKRLGAYKAQFIAGTILRALGDLCTLYQAYALGYVITTISRGGFQFSKILMVLGMWCFLMVVRQFFLSGSKRFIYNTAEKVEVDVLHEGLDHLISLDSSWHEEENTGNKIKRIQNGAESYNMLIRIWVNNIIEIVVNFIGISIIIAKTDTRMTGFILVYVAVYYLISTSLLKKARAKAHLVNIAEENANGILYENVNAVRTVKLLSIKGYVLSLYKKTTDAVLAAMKNSIVWSQARTRSVNVWTHLMATGGIAFIVWGIMHGRYEVGFIAVFYSYMGSIRESVSELSNISETITLSGQKIDRYEDFKKIETKTESTAGKKDFPSSWSSIFFKDVSFSYKEDLVLSGLDFVVNRGEKIGIVGLSGAGKSTIFKLLLKEREDYGGAILIDNVPLKDISPLEYRKRVGVVLQDTEVFNTSLKDNIIIGSSEDEEYFDAVLGIAHIKDFAEKLKDGVHTKIGEKGIKLSGGERQRLGIARALFKKPDILLLDEATSHLDLESEMKIKDSLHAAFSHVTAIVIAHRLTTIKEMDRILIIEDGRIVEEGSFDTLYKKQGRFYQLWEMQKM